MNSFNPNYYIDIGNILLLVAYSVRDILWLRLFAVAAALVTIPYFVLQPAPLWVPVAWTVVFAAINLFQSFRLFIERRPVKLTADEEAVRRLIFQDVPPKKVLQVLAIGSWTNLEIGERLIERGKTVDAVWLIIGGKVRVAKSDSVFMDLAVGGIVGDALLLSGAPAAFDAVVVERLRAIRWEAGTLQRYLAANPETRILLQQYFERDLSEKVDYMGKELPT